MLLSPGADTRAFDVARTHPDEPSKASESDKADSLGFVNRRLLTILTATVVASVAAGCSTLDTDEVARVGDATLSEDELDELLVAAQVLDNDSIEISRQAISNWIFETTVSEGLVTEELLAGLPEGRLIPAYNEGIEAAGITCPIILVVESEAVAETVVASLDDGADVAATVAEFNMDPQLGSTDGLAGCFPLEQFDQQSLASPEVGALLRLDDENRFDYAPTPSADGTTAALVVGFRLFEDLDPTEAAQVSDSLRQTVGLRLLVEDVDIDVASRYGTFDVDLGGVVPLG